MSTTAMNGSSMPPKRLGWWKRNSPMSCSSFSFSGSSTRASSHFCARDASTGTISRARRIASSLLTFSKLTTLEYRMRLVGLFLLSLLLQHAAAQPYPSRPVRLIVPAPAGGPTDVPGRLVADGMTEQLAQRMVVENRVGAGGLIAAEEIGRAHV